jgi:hypothetical protein
MAVGQSRVYALQPNIGDAAEIAIGGSGTIIGQATENLGGMEGLNGQVRFLLGTGSGGVNLFIQTSLDQGSSWFDIYKAEFDAVSDIRVFAIRTVTTGDITPTSGGTGDSPDLADGIVCSVLGDRLRAYVVNTGTYQNTQLSIRVMPI